VADSSCSLPAGTVSCYRIRIVPLSLVVDGESFLDGDQAAPSFYERLSRAGGRVSTASPPPGDFLRVFQAAAAQSTAILCITLSSRYSATFAAASEAARLFLEERPGFPLQIWDSRNLAMAHGLVVLAAAKAAADGEGLNACRKAAEGVAERVYLVGMLDTLDYLARSGRIPRAAAWAGSLLQIKPILAADREEVRAVERVRTRPRAMRRLLELVENRVGQNTGLHVAVAHTNAPDLAEDLRELVDRTLRPKELLMCEFTAVMGVHTGPGLVGLAFYNDIETGPSPVRELAAASTPVS